MNLVLGVLLGTGLAAALAVAWGVVRAPRVVHTPEALGMQSALHAASSTLPHLRRGLNPRSAALAVPHLRALTGAAAIALADTRAVLAIEGEGLSTNCCFGGADLRTLYVTAGRTLLEASMPVSGYHAFPGRA